MPAVPAMFSTHSVSFFVNGNLYAADETLPGYPELLEELKKANPDHARLVALTQPIQAVREAVETAETVHADYLPKGTVSVTKQEIRYNGQAIDGVLVERILQMLAEGFDIMPMVRFLENLYQNPAEFARNELYLWLENSDLPITEDGHFLAYKKVLDNFRSVTGGLVDNTPGNIVSMPREDVDPNRERTCSSGLHFCSKSYLPHFSGSRTVLLKINPADVVSIPSDYDNAKGRAWKYEVLAAVKQDPQTLVWAAVVSPDGGEVVVGQPEVVEAGQPVLRLDVTSDLAKSLFAAYNEIAIDRTDRVERLDWASQLIDNDIDTFADLTIAEAEVLLAAAREQKEILDSNTIQNVYQAQIDAINSYGIITLRRKASEAGLPGAWHNFKAAELRRFLIDKVQ